MFVFTIEYIYIYMYEHKLNMKYLKERIFKIYAIQGAGINTRFLLLSNIIDLRFDLLRAKRSFRTDIGKTLSHVSRGGGCQNSSDQKFYIELNVLIITVTHRTVTHITTVTHRTVTHIITVTHRTVTHIRQPVFIP
jgi:hypothetical protein